MKSQFATSSIDSRFLQEAVSGYLRPIFLLYICTSLVQKRLILFVVIICCCHNFYSLVVSNAQLHTSYMSTSADI